jgi:hypothetical protein
MINLTEEGWIMRKMLLLVVMLPFFALIGCSGGGADPTAALDGGAPGGGGGAAANLGNVSFWISPNAASGLVDQGGAVENAARIVVSGWGKTGVIKCVDPYTITTACFYDEEIEDWLTGQTLTVCNDPLKETADDPDPEAPAGCEIIRNQSPTTANPAAQDEEEGYIKVVVSDTYIPPAGGWATAFVPEGVNYTLQMVAYTSGTFNKTADTFTPVGATQLNTAGPNPRITTGNFMTGKVNLLRRYWKSVGDFSIVANPTGDENKVIISEVTPIAALSIPNPAGSPYVSGESYNVSSSRSSALRDLWYLRTNMDESPDNIDLWLIRETSNEVKTSATGGPVTVDTVIIPSTDACVTPSDPACSIWHHGQFFISPDLLSDGENYTQWIFGKTVEGELEAWWGAGFVVCGNLVCEPPEDAASCPADCP